MQNQKKNTVKATSIAASVIAGSLLSVAALANSSSAFSFRSLGNGNEVRNELSSNTRALNMDLTCGAGKAKDSKCGDKKDSTMSKAKDGKCGEGKCGDTKKKAAKKDVKKPTTTNNQ